MNRLVLIGNGFDLAHDLKTNYADFIYWYWKQRIDELLYANSTSSNDYLCTLEITGEYWSKFYSTNLSFIKRTSGDKLYHYLIKNVDKFRVEHSSLFSLIHKNIETKGWVDIENDYYTLLEKRVLPIRSSTEKDVQSLNFQLDIIRAKLIEYLKREQKKKINAIESVKEKIYRPIALQEISVYFKNMLDKSVLRDVNPHSIMLLNFNYTNTPEKYVTDRSKVRINYIHGNIYTPEGVIFGYGDELDDDYKKLKNLNENECLRHIKSMHYLESANYREVLEFMESGRFQVVIMGHSCGNSDRTLLNTIFEHRNCISIKPYYYQKDGKDNYLDLVMNICRNFTDMKLMRDRVVNKCNCEQLVD